MQDRVLIVGGGPVGLVLACELKQQGVDARVIDAERRLSQHSRSNVIWSRSLELLDRIGVADALVAQGHQADGIAYYSYGRRLGATLVRKLDDLVYPFALMIPQNDTEAVLEQRFTELGGRIERGVRLTYLDASGDRPVAKLEHADGQVEETTVDWLIGADGAHSTVRKQLGIEYDGPQVNVTIAITDAVIDSALDNRLAHHCYSLHGSLVLAPLGGDVYRIAVSVPHQEDGTAPSRELFQRLIDERAPGSNTVGELSWSTYYRIRCATAATFRAGRCFLAGDAAHIISPAAGQGMNTGIQDAVNLGWKLGAVIRGTSDEQILDSYDRERRQVVQRVARASAFQTKFGVVGSRYKVAIRDAAIMGAHYTGLLQRYMARQLSQTNVQYTEEEPSGLATLAGRPAEVPPGARLPVRLGGAEGPSNSGYWPTVAADGYTVLLWRGRAAHAGWQQARDRIRAALAADVSVLDLASSAPAPLARALGDAPTAAIVRPDGHLLTRVPVHRPDRLAEELRLAAGRL
ncbi:FAD-dependent monooxygenase [Streptomyces morookaense]|uniref:FAD-dependent monooxygenase n=1 Tax=Streptomyces morookaense TaxID=1970 RepID=UPI0033D0A798